MKIRVAACCAAALLLILMLTGVYALAAEKAVWLPDINTAFQAEGKYVKTSTEKNGVTYNLYTYDFKTDYQTCAHAIVAYTEAVKTLGYTSKKLKLSQNEVWYQGYTKGGFTAELGLFVSDHAKDIAEGGTGDWRAVLAVPVGMVFNLSDSAPGVFGGRTTCCACGGSRKCAGCAGQGRVNYGSDKEDCVLCGGSGRCTVCEGEGAY